MTDSKVNAIILKLTEVIKDLNELKVLDPVTPPIEAFEFKRSPAFELLNVKAIYSPNPRYKLRYFFTTDNGSWEPSSSLYSVPKWARDLFLKPYSAPDYFDDAGGAQNIFGAVIGKDGILRKDVAFRFSWSQGSDVRQVKHRSGWANSSVFNSFSPNRGENGGWTWFPMNGEADMIQGGGLPGNNHISQFAVWQEI